jgi:hypothetical protein
MKLLRSRADQYPLLLELREPPGMEHPIDEARRAIEKLNGIETNE